MKILENYTQVKGLFLGSEGRWDRVGLQGQGGPFPQGRAQARITSCPSL